MTLIVAVCVLLLALCLGVELEARMTPLPPNVVPPLRTRGGVAAESCVKQCPVAHPHSAILGEHRGLLQSRNDGLLTDIGSGRRDSAICG